VAVLWIVAGDEVVEIAALQRILISTAALPLRADAPPVYLAAARFFEGEVFVGAQVVNPDIQMPVRLALHGFSAVGLPSKTTLTLLPKIV